MKRKNLTAALALTLSLGIGATVYAASGTGSSSSNKLSSINCMSQQGLGLGMATGMRGYDYVESALLKLGVTEKEITEGTAAGKTLYEIAEAKGISADKFKAAIVDEKLKAVDDAVKGGKISKEQGDTIKATIQANSNNCTPGQNSGQMRGMGGGKGRGNCSGMGFGRGAQ